MSAETHKYIKVLFRLRRRLRLSSVQWRGAFSLGLAGCFAWTSLVTPLVQAQAQERAFSPRSSRYDEFGNSPEDSSYFSPQRLRERMEKMENWIQGQNARLAFLQGRGDPGASEEYSDQVRRYSVERFLVQGEMKDELEAKRAQTSRQLAQAGGFHFKQFKDGKREWYKNGKVQRVENEKIIQNGRELRRETLDMTYDTRGNLAGYRTETRDETGRVIGTSRWEGKYSEGRRQNARLLSFTENSWDALGNATRLDRTNIQWTSDGKKTLSYTDTETDAYGKVTKRDVSDSTYNTDGQLTSYKEVTLSHTGETFTKIWSDGKYEKNAKDEWSLSSYKESVTDANGRRTEREWGQAKYDEKGRLTSFTEKNTNMAGKTSTRRWENGRYDDRGQLTGYEENITDEKGRSSFRGWEGGRYDENGRIVGYEERTVDADGAAGWRQFKNAEYNSKNEMIGFSEKIMDARGELSDHDWFGKDYTNGLLTHSFETTTDSRGRSTSKDWTGVYGEKDRLASFIETNTDIAGQTSTRGQDKLVYDALGRMVSYNETNTDAFGIESSQVWTATGFDEEDRVTGYETREKTPAGEQLRRRNNITHTASGRIASYDEEVEVAGANGTPLITKTRWSGAVYGSTGDLLSYNESTTNPAGETSSHQWGGKYDSLGRLVSYVDERTGAAGPPVTVRWSASSFDAFDHATNLTETMAANGAPPRERAWSGSYDKRGLVIKSLETVRVGVQTLTTQLNSAAYDTKGRLTDSDSSLRRSDMPDLVSETKVTGQKYDDAGHVIGGSEVTHLTGRTPLGAIDLTITGATAHGTFADGKLTGYEQSKIIIGTDDRGQAVHIQDVTAVALGDHGDRKDVTHHMAFNAQNQLVAEKTTTVRQTGTVQDLQGRTLTAQQASFDDGNPDVITTSQIKNTYGATGDLALSIEDSTDALGVRTVRKTENLATDAAGRTFGSRTTITRPGMTVTEEVTEQSNMVYDALGRSAGSHEESTTTGPGLFTRSSLDRTVKYDGAGNAAVTRETGHRNGAAYESTTTNEGYNLSGQVTAYQEKGWSADGGVTDSRRTGIGYNKYGQADTYTDEGIVGGQYRLNHHTALARDAFGREIRSLEEGINESGKYRYENRTPSFNSLGQATARFETGWKASEGNYTLAQNNIRYDIAGRQLDFDQTKTVDGQTRETHWSSKGYDKNGASLGYRETGMITAGTDAGVAIAEDQSVGATNSLGQVVSYVTVSVKTFTDGSTQTSTVNWSNGIYDEAGRLDGFIEDTTTVTTEKDGTTKTTRNARERHHTTHADVSGEPNTDGASAIAGFTSGYTETLYKDGDPAKAERVEVTNMVYDSNGLYYDSKTLRGKTDRFKDALRGLSSMLFGTEGPLSKTGRALTRLFDLTEGLMEQVGNWLETAVEGGRELLNSLLGLPSGSPTGLKAKQLSAAKLATLTDALREAIGTNQLQNLPTDLRPAVQSFGALDEAPVLTRRTATVYDAQGRAVTWKEYSLTAASTKPIYSEVKVTYQGASSQMASYEAKTIDGEKITHTIRDKFAYDAQGRESYREINFDGDDIKLLPTDQGTESTVTPDQAVSGVSAGWNTLTVTQKTALLDDIFSKKTEVLGKVEFYIPELIEYDATGAVENMFTNRVTRGTELFDLADKLDLSIEGEQAYSDVELGLKKENEDRLAAQDTIISNIEEKIAQEDKNIGANQSEYDKKNAVLEKAKTEEKAVNDQVTAIADHVNEITKNIVAYKGKEIYRELIPPTTIKFRTSPAPQERRFTANGRLMREITEVERFFVLRISSSGEFEESTISIEKKTLSAALRSLGRGNFEWETVSRNAREIPGNDAKKLFSINDDKSVLAYFHRIHGLKKFLAQSVSEVKSNPDIKNLSGLCSDRLRSNAKLDELKPVLKSKAETTSIEQSAFNVIESSLKSLEAQRKIDEESLSAAKTDLDNLKISLAEEKSRKLAEAKAGLDLLIGSLSSDLGANAVLAGGKTINFSVSDWEAILKGEMISKGGKQWDRASLSANGIGKHSLDSEEHVARLAMNVAGQTQTLAWKGAMTMAGQSVDGKDMGLIKQIATLAENASSQGPPGSTPTIPGLSFNGDGHLSVTLPPEQTLDGLGRLTSQTSKTYTLSRWNNDTSASIVTQTSNAYRYDTLGNLIGFDRVTSEPGKNPVHEIMLSAQYDTQGRQRASETKVVDETGTYTIRMTNDGYDTTGHPINTQRVKIQGTSVTVTKEIGNAISDEWGHNLFSASENLSTTLDDWSKNPDFKTAAGQRGKGYIWNTGFNAGGDITDSFRVTEKASGPEGSHFVFESTHFTYKPAGAGTEAGRLATSVSKVMEMGHDAKTGATLFRSYTDENTVTTYSATGQALFQTTLHTENGVTKKTEDNKARQYDASGRLTETDTTTTDASGLKTRNYYKATDFDQAGRATSFVRSSYQGDIKTFEEKVTDATYDANGNLMGQNSKISEWDEDGKGLKTSTKTERGNTYNLFGQLTKSITTTTHTDSNNVTITDTKETGYAYDLSGRVVKTTVNGQEVNGGAIKPYNSIQEILSWDKYGRAARTRNSATVDGLTTEKISLHDIQYDAQGRVISGHDLVHKTGKGLSQYSEEAMDVKEFDSWGRAIKYTQTLVDGGLRTQSDINLTYNADGVVTSQTTNVVETSINALVDHHVERTIKQTDMKYDALGNLVDYKKVVKEGDLETTSKALLMEYDQYGRPTTALERVSDTTGRDEIVGQVGVKYNNLGQVVDGPGQGVTISGESGALDNKANLEKVVAGIKAGAFKVNDDKEGKRLVEELGYKGIWVKQTTEPILYDQQGRANHIYTVTNKVGWGTIDVPVTEVVFDQNADVHDGWKYSESFEKRKQALQAQGFEITGSTFDWEGDTKHNRYCRAIITYLKPVAAVVSTHEPSTVDVKVFDALNRPLVQTVKTYMGINETKNEQFLTYNTKGQVAEINGKVTETGKNADGGDLNRTYSQKQSFTYNTLGQTTKESTQTWGDSQAPLKITTSVVGDIKYGSKGERLGWEEETSTNDSTVTEVRRISGATYDGLGRLSTYTAVAYDRVGGVEKLKYIDQNVINTYDNKGRLSRSVSQRKWGDNVDLTVLSAEEAQKAATASDKSGQAGGGVSGLDEGWTSGSAVVVTTYQYGENGNSISSMTVTAHGTGTNTNSEVQSMGIHLTYTQSNIKYDSTGRATSYHLKTTQIEHYDYYTQVQKGLKRKNARKSVTEAVTTESDVQVLEFDGFGRQVHTVVESNRSDKNQTWTRTDTRVKTFDDQGRAKDVDRQTQSKMTVLRKKGSLGMKILSVAVMMINPIVGAAMLASTSLGGQNIYSYSHTVSQNQYKADGTLDEVATKAKTTTLEENTYQQGKNFGDKTMQAVDIAVAVGAVVAAVVLAIIPGTQALAAFCIAAATAIYAVARRGISTHDLGMFGENHDRAEAKQNAMAFYSSVVSVCVAGAGAWMNSTNPGTWTTMATVAKTGEQIKVLTDTARYTLMAVSVAGQLGAAAAGGADAKTLWTVGALSVTSGLMSGGVSAGDSGATMTYTQGAIAISGALVQNIGMTYGKESQRTTWMLTGSMAQGASQGATGTAVYAGLRSYLVDLYARKSDGSGLADTDRLRRGMVVHAAGELMGTVMSVMSSGFQEAWSTGKKGDPITATRVFEAIKGSLSAPWKALSAGAQGFMLALGAIGDFAMKGIKTVNSAQLPDGSQIHATGIKVARDGSMIIPVGARREVFDIGGGPVKIGDREYTRGSFVFNGTDWLLEGEGQTYEDSYGGLRLSDGGKIPTKVRSTEYGVVPVGIEWGLLEGKNFNSISPTRLPGFGSVFAGSFKVAKGSLQFFDESLYHVDGELNARYRVREGVEFPAKVEGNKFSLLINEIPQAHGQRLHLSGDRISGIIKNGQASVLTTQVNSLATLTGKFGSTNLVAEGKVELKWVNGEILINGSVTGDALWSAPTAGGKLSGAGKAFAERQIAPSQFTILAEKNGLYHLNGTIAITEAGAQPFVAKSTFQMKLGVELAWGEVSYRQNWAKGWFTVGDKGDLLAPEMSVALNRPTGDMVLFGEMGSVLLNVKWGNESGRPILKEILTPTAQKLFGRIDMKENGNGRLFVLGHGGRQLFIELTSLEASSPNSSVDGITSSRPEAFGVTGGTRRLEGITDYGKAAGATYMRYMSNMVNVGLYGLGQWADSTEFGVKSISSGVMGLFGGRGSPTSAAQKSFEGRWSQITGRMIGKLSNAVPWKGYEDGFSKGAWGMFRTFKDSAAIFGTRFGAFTLRTWGAVEAFGVYYAGQKIDGGISKVKVLKASAEKMLPWNWGEESAPSFNRPLKEGIGSRYANRVIEHLDSVVHWADDKHELAKGRSEEQRQWLAAAQGQISGGESVFTGAYLGVASFFEGSAMAMGGRSMADYQKDGSSWKALGKDMVDSAKGFGKMFMVFSNLNEKIDKYGLAGLGMGLTETAIAYRGLWEGVGSRLTKAYSQNIGVKNGIAVELTTTQRWKNVGKQAALSAVEQGVDAALPGINPAGLMINHITITKYNRTLGGIKEGIGVKGEGIELIHQSGNKIFLELRNIKGTDGLWQPRLNDIPVIGEKAAAKGWKVEIVTADARMADAFRAEPGLGKYFSETSLRSFQKSVRWETGLTKKEQAKLEKAENNYNKLANRLDKTIEARTTVEQKFLTEKAGLETSRTQVKEVLNQFGKGELTADVAIQKIEGMAGRDVARELGRKLADLTRGAQEGGGDSGRVHSRPKGWEGIKLAAASFLQKVGRAFSGNWRQNRRAGSENPEGLAGDSGFQERAEARQRVSEARQRVSDLFDKKTQVVELKLGEVGQELAQLRAEKATALDGAATARKGIEKTGARLSELLDHGTFLQEALKSTEKGRSVELTPLWSKGSVDLPAILRSYRESLGETLPTQAESVLTPETILREKGLNATPKEFLSGVGQSLKSSLSNIRGGILVEGISVQQAYHNLKESILPSKAKSLPAAPSDGPPIGSPKTPASLSDTQYDLARPDETVVRPTPRSTPNEPNFKPTEFSALHQAILEKNYKKILPEDYLKLETVLRLPERIETTVHDAATGATNLQVINPNTKVVVTIDGKGNVLKINDPSKTPRAQSPLLNKANAPRAGPQSGDIGRGALSSSKKFLTLQDRQNALLHGDSGVNITSRSEAVKYGSIGKNNRTFLTDLKAVEDVIGPLKNDRMKISPIQARQLETSLGLKPNSLERRNIIYIVNDVAKRAVASPISGNTLFGGGGKGLPGGGPEVTVQGIPSAGGQGVRQIILEVN